MSDLVERLRKFFPVRNVTEGKVLMHEAADEIERLRFALAVIAGGHHLGTVEDYVERTLRATDQPSPDL